MVVLLTEDSADLRELTKLLLEAGGHTVETARDGLEAIAVAAARIPDVILMDLRMPVMDGFQATRELRKREDTRDIPIIAVSAYVSDKAWCDRAMAAGVNACVPKPVDIGALEAVLEKYAS